MAFPTGYSCRGVITIPPDQVSGTGDLADFVVFIDGAMLSPTGVFDAATGCRPDAGDLRLAMASDGTGQIPVDIGVFDKTTPAKTGMHVKVPALHGNSATPIYVYWIGPNSTEVRPVRDSAYGGEAVWTDYELSVLAYGDSPTMDRTAQRRHHYYGQLERSGRTYIPVAYEAGKHKAFPSIISTANGRQLLTFRGGASIHGNETAGYVDIYRSTDGARSFSSLSTIGAADSTRDYRDPELYEHNDASNTLYCFTTKVDPAAAEGSKHSIWYYRSTDGGGTFDGGTLLTSTNGMAQGKPIRLESGLIAIPWYEINSSAQQRPMLTLLNPADQSKTDYVVNAAWNSYNEWSLIENTATNPNTLRGFFRSATADGVYTSTATVDAPGTWGAFSTLVATSARDAIEANRISTGDVLIAYAYEDAAVGTNVTIRRSTDHGATLTSGDFCYLVVEDEPITNGTGYYPSFCEISPGLFAWAIYAEASGGVAPAYVITGTFELGATGKLVGWTNTGTVPVKSSSTGGTGFIGDVNYCPRQADATNPLNYPHQTATFTLAAMLKLTNYTDAGSQGIISTAASSADKGFLFDFEGTNDQIRVSRYLGGSSVIHASANNAIADNNYHIVHASIAAGTPSFFVDGVSKGGSGAGSGTATGNATRATNIGRYNHSTPGGALNGRIGWVYCRKSAISADWAATEAANWSAPSTFGVGAAWIELNGAAAVVATSSGALSTGITLAGQGAAVSLADGVLTAQITLSGTALAQALAAAGLTTGIPLVGGGAGQAAAAGELSAGVGLAGAAAALADSGGSLTTQIRLDGAALAQALAGGDLSTTPAGLSGAAGAQATAAGVLLTGIPLAGAAQAYATAAGGLTTIIPLSGAAASVSSATGDITVESTLSGAAIALALAGGDLTTLIRLDGAAVARAAASGALAGHVAVISRHVVRATAGVWKVTATI